MADSPMAPWDPPGTTPPVRPVFLFSLPRSGSTLLQRILAAHPAVATTSEPWLLLPLLYSLRTFGVKAEYSQRWMAEALRDFVAELPRGEEDYWEEIRELVLRLYAKAAGDSKYFVDKTPQYHYVVSEILELFPDGRFIFLWRNPLAVMASVLETWTNGRWNLDAYRPVLEGGFARLVTAYEAHRDRVVSVSYEDLVRDSEATVRAVLRYLDLDFEPGMVERFADVRLPGRMRDPSGVERYGAITTASLDRWKEALANPVRKRWARGYLVRMGEERLATVGYDLDELLAELRAVPSSTRRAVSDFAWHAYGWTYEAAKARVLRTTFERPDARSARPAP